MTADFRSDNTHGASPEILAAMARAGERTATSYGDDELTHRLRARIRELFETDCDIVPVMTGTAGNALTVSVMTPPWGGVFCHDEAHIHRDELGAPEFYSGGAKLFPIRTAGGKLAPERLAEAIDHIATEGRTANPACVSLTNATEAGTVYTPEETRALCEVAHARGCRVHLDGARFANAVAGSGASAADLTWRAGVDALVFGATKNGALAAELIVVFDRELMRELPLRWHRGGHRLSKMRFLSAQWNAYLDGDLWLRNARHANAMAARLAGGLVERRASARRAIELSGGLKPAAPQEPEEAMILQPVEANSVFARITPDAAARLKDAGFRFYDWPLYGPHAYRFVCGFTTTEAEVEALLAALQGER